MPQKVNGILALFGTPTGDGRQIENLHWDDNTTWPIKYQATAAHHDAPVVGELTHIWRDGDTLRGEGVLHTETEHPEILASVNRIMELMADNKPVGVSLELDSESVELRVDKAVWDEWQESYDEDAPAAPEREEVDGRVVVEKSRFDNFLQVVTDARVRGVAIVDTPAFVEAQFLAASLGASGAEAFTNPMFGTDGDTDPRLVVQSPTRPEEPAGWGCPLTITDDGEIFGHVALKVRCHGAYEACVTPPYEQDFSHFLTGEAVRGVPTGVITQDTTHGIGPGRNHDHLANTGLAVADVAVGNDDHGIWVAGRVRPGITEAQLATLKGSALSGEWHPIGGRLRLVGILAVNTPGYLIQRRALAASMGILYTAGPGCCDDAGPTFDDRLAALERAVMTLYGASVPK